MVATIKYDWVGFEEHDSLLFAPKECAEAAYEMGERVHWRGKAFNKQVQGVGTILGKASSDQGVMTQWIVQLEPEDAPLFLPGGFTCTAFPSFHLRSVRD